MRGRTTNLTALSADTRDYFLKLPGYDTLRLVLARRAILVEGPSDELIVQKAFQMQYGMLPLEVGVDVITVGSLAFRRFLQIAELLETKVDVVTDNDGDATKLEERYSRYVNHPHIRIQYDTDNSVPSLEQQLLKANGRDTTNSIIGKKYQTDDEILSFLRNNKTECALRFFEAVTPWKAPEYIVRAISE